MRCKSLIIEENSEGIGCQPIILIDKHSLIRGNASLLIFETVHTQYKIFFRGRYKFSFCYSGSSQWSFQFFFFYSSDFNAIQCTGSHIILNMYSPHWGIIKKWRKGWDGGGEGWSGVRAPLFLYLTVGVQGYTVHCAVCMTVSLHNHHYKNV